MAFEWLKNILGDHYTEEIDTKVAAEIGKSFVARADFNTLKEKKNDLAQQLETAGTEIQSYKDMDIEGIKKAAAEWEARAQQAEKDAQVKQEADRFENWFNGLVSQSKGRNAEVIRTLAGTERLQALRTSQNQDTDGRALMDALQKENAYAFEDQTPPPPPYAAHTGAGSMGAAERSANDEMQDMLFPKQQ